MPLEEIRAAEFKRSILIVDDDPQIRKFFTDVLTEAGYAVYDVGNGVEAKAAIQSINFNLIILDLSMPEMDGYEVLKFARAELPDLKIIVASGFIQGTMVKAATLFGVLATLNKPVEATVLLSAARAAMDG